MWNVPVKALSAAENKRVTGTERDKKIIIYWPHQLRKRTLTSEGHVWIHSKQHKYDCESTQVLQRVGGDHPGELCEIADASVIFHWVICRGSSTSTDRRRLHYGVTKASSILLCLPDPARAEEVDTVSYPASQSSASSVNGHKLTPGSGWVTV